jgi:preprotein translocase subunit YajC
MNPYIATILPLLLLIVVILGIALFVIIRKHKRRGKK